MIVHHKAGEFTSGMMSRQYRTAFNSTAGGVAAAGTPLFGLLVWHPFLWVWPAGVIGVTYLLNLRGRFYRVRPYELKKPTKHTEDEILELQDIYYRMPKEHRGQIEKLLEAAYSQVERGNVDAVVPRLEQARKFKGSVIDYNAKSDDRSDLAEVEAAAKAMHRAIEA